MTKPDPDAVMVQAVLLASDQPMTTELLLSAAKAYAALKSSREREERHLAERNRLTPHPEERPYVGEGGC